MSIIKFINDTYHCFLQFHHLNLLSKKLVMPTKLTPEIRQVIKAVHYLPSVSIIMPFEPKMSLKKDLLLSLKLALNKVEEEILKNYPADMGVLVMHKLQSITSDLNFNTHKKSIAIYVSPVFQKVLYLDLLVQEKIKVDDSFEIRELVYSKLQTYKYLVLLLCGKSSRIYVGNLQTFVRIISDTSTASFAYENDTPEGIAIFDKINNCKEIVEENFLHHIDNTLGIILNAYNLPLFVMGTEKITAHFKKLTKHTKSVNEFINGNFEEATTDVLKNVLVPFIKDWKKVMEKKVINKLEEAASKKKLAIGMKEVWDTATNYKGQLLVVESNYMYAAGQGGIEDIIYTATQPYNKFSYVKDAVDDIIEKILENGGDVEFVDKGVLQNYQHIALVKYYR